MNEFIIFSWIIVAFASIAFWEAYMEGADGWASRQVGWKVKVGSRYHLTGYHFWLFGVTIPMFLVLAWYIGGLTVQLGATLVCGYLVGMVLEDFLWFVVNPRWKLSEFRPDKVWWYPWLKLGRTHGLPYFYLPALAAAALIWFGFVR